MPKPADSPLPPGDSPARPNRRSGAPAGLPGFDDLKPKAARSRADELQYFMVRTNCVQCRRTVQAPVDKLHFNLRCPRCGARMHMTEDGSWHAGVHPEMRKESAAHSQAASPARNRRTRGSIPVPAILRRRSTQLVALLLGFCGLVFAVLEIAGPPADNLPTTLEERAELLRSAVLNNDDILFRRLIDTDTDADASHWKKIVRSRLGESSPRDFAAISHCKVLFSNWEERLAAVALTLQTDGSATWSVVTFWTLDDDAYWMFDGRRTLKDMKLSGAAVGKSSQDQGRQ